jgi:hypothetical protein
LLAPQWRDELKNKFDIPADIATGKKLIAAEPERGAAPQARSARRSIVYG